MNWPRVWPLAEGVTWFERSDINEFTAWAFGRRLEAAGILPSMGTVGDCCDNSMMESFWGTMQLELLDRRIWQTRSELANVIFEWIECWCNPKRRHSRIGMLSPTEFETRHTPPDHGAD
jgi:putative transposase